MNKRFLSIGARIIILSLIVAYAVAFVAIAEKHYRENNNNKTLFVISSPINEYSISVDYLYRDSGGYGEYDEITLLDGNGNRNAVWILFIPNDSLMNSMDGVPHACKDSLVVDWKTDSVMFNICGTNYAINVNYDDVLNRDINVSQFYRILGLTSELFILLFSLFVGLLLFSSKNKRALVIFIVIAIVFHLSALIMSVSKYKKIDDIIINSSETSDGYSISIYNRNILVLSSYLDRIYLYVLDDSVIDKNPVSFSTYLAGDIRKTEFLVDYSGDAFHICINGDDHLIFDVIIRD